MFLRIMIVIKTSFLQAINPSVVRQLTKLYFSLEPGSLNTSVGKFYRLVKEKHPRISYKDTSNFLRSVAQFTLHKQSHAPRHTNSFRHVYFPYDLIGFDIIFIPLYQGLTDETRTALLIKDFISKYVWIYHLKNRASTTINEAFKKFIEAERDYLNPATKFLSDREASFLTKTFKALTHPYMHQFSYRKTHTSFVEVEIRWVKMELAKYVSYYQKGNAFDILAKIIEKRNNTKRDDLFCLTPKELLRQQHLQYLYFWKKFPLEARGRVQSIMGQSKHRTFHESDYVRILNEKKPMMAKESDTRETRWSPEIYRVLSISYTFQRPKYQLVKLGSKQPEPRKFYDFEMQKINFREDALYEIEKVHKRRVENGRRQMLVSFRRYPDKFWIDETQAVPLREQTEY